MNNTSITNIRGLHSNLIWCESFLKSNFPAILALYETNLDDSIDSGNFSGRGYLPLMWKDCITHLHGPAGYVKEGFPFAWGLSLENSEKTYLSFWLTSLHSVFYFFFLYWSPSLSSCTISDNILCNIDEVPYIIRDDSWFSNHLLMYLEILISIIRTG